MGHIHLAVLPNTVKWRTMTELLATGASDRQVIAASAAAAERDLERAARDPVFVEAIRLLAMIPFAATGEAFGQQLRNLGLQVSDRPSLPLLVAATGSRLDRVQTRHAGVTDFSELSRQTLLGTLTATIGAELPSLFGASPEEVQTATAGLARPVGFTPFARSFFARLLSQTLSNYLDRKLSTLVGPGQRFGDIGERQAFNTTLDRYSSEATSSIGAFSWAWYARTILRDGQITSERSAAFGALALRKVTEELVQHA